MSPVRPPFVLVADGSGTCSAVSATDCRFIDCRSTLESRFDLPHFGLILICEGSASPIYERWELVSGCVEVVQDDAILGELASPRD